MAEGFEAISSTKIASYREGVATIAIPLSTFISEGPRDRGREERPLIVSHIGKINVLAPNLRPSGLGYP
jgi:hypothetical protein